MDVRSSFSKHQNISLFYLSLRVTDDPQNLVFGNQNKTTNSELFRNVVTHRHGSTLEASLVCAAFARVIM